MSVWNCKESSCRVGEWYPVASPQLSGAATLATLQDNAQSCQPCPFYPRGAFTNFSELNGRTFGEVSDFVSSISTKTCAIASQLCPAVASLRLVESPNLECREQVWPFTGIASALMLLIFTAGTPFIYGFLIREHSRRYDALPADPAADPDDQWAWRVQPSVANKARNLYSDFEFKWRYYKLFVLFQKLALVGTLLYVGDFPIVAAMAFTFIHAAFLIINSIMRPYLDPRPDMLAIAVSIVSTFNPLMALVAFVNLGVPEWMGLAMLLINVRRPRRPRRRATLRSHAAPPLLLALRDARPPRRAGAPRVRCLGARARLIHFGRHRLPHQPAREEGEGRCAPRARID